DLRRYPQGWSGCSSSGTAFPRQLRRHATPCEERDRRATESRITAINSTTPVTMNRMEESRFNSTSPLEMDWITATPSSAAKAPPRPPNRLQPPITAAAIAFRFTSPVPVVVLAEVRRAAASTPPTAARPEQRMKQDR